MKPKPGGSPEPKYIDRPEVSEIFADRLEHMFFDGGTIRMEFTVTRTDPANNAPGKPMTEPRRWSYTACRIVLSGRGVAEMLNKMQELQGVMLQQGFLQPRGPEVAAPAVTPPVMPPEPSEPAAE